MPYDIKEESKEIADNLKNNRGTIIVLILSSIAGGLIVDKLKEEGIVERIKGLFKKGDYEEYEEEWYGKIWNANSKTKKISERIY